MAGAGADCAGLYPATAASGLFGSRLAGRTDGGGRGMPDGGGMDGGATGAPGIGAGRDGTGMGAGGAWDGDVAGPDAAGGGGVGAPGPPIFCSRDLRSIFGFLSSAIVRGATLRAPAPPCQRDEARSVGGSRAIVGVGPVRRFRLGFGRGSSPGSG